MKSRIERVVFELVDINGGKWSYIPMDKTLYKHDIPAKTFIVKDVFHALTFLNNEQMISSVIEEKEQEQNTLN